MLKYVIMWVFSYKFDYMRAFFISMSLPKQKLAMSYFFTKCFRKEQVQICKSE